MNSSKRVKDIRKGLIIAIILFAICLCGVSAFSGYRSYSKGIVDRYDAYLLNVAELCLSELDGNELEKCIETGTKNEAYEKMKKHIDHVKSTQSTEYIYLCVPKNHNSTGNIMYVMEGYNEWDYRSNGANLNTLGTMSTEEFTLDTISYYDSIMSGRRDQLIFESKSSAGDLHSVLVPVKNTKGQPVCVLGIDISTEEIRGKTTQFFTDMGIACGTILVVFLVFMLCWLKKKVTDPLLEMERVNTAAREEAEAANLAKSNFLFSMSHDIRTPLHAITGYTRMAKKHCEEPEKVNNYLDKIETSGDQLLTLVNQVLEMARIESGKMQLDENPVNIKEDFAAIETVLMEQARISGLKLHFSLVDIVHNFIYADRGRMTSVIMNIAGNAMKYTPEGGSIYFIFKENNYAVPGLANYTLVVADTGIGMSEEYQRILFEPFTREDRTTVTKVQGTGLGLSIVKSLVDMLGGTISVDSELGKGTRFEVNLTFKIKNHEVEAQKKQELDSSAFRGCRILLVDDNALNREIAKDFLEDKGILVDEADDGDVAVDMVRKRIESGEKGYYDFILMDVQMPRMDGYEATKYIRGMTSERYIPIIALSANAFAEDKASSLAAGMDDHVAKPIDLNKLFEIMSKYMKK